MDINPLSSEQAGRSKKNFGAVVLLAVAFLLVMGGSVYFNHRSAQGITVPTLTLNDSTIVQATTARSGLNIGAVDYYDSGQVLKNLVGSIDPGFEPLGQRQIWALNATGTAASFTDPQVWDEVPTNYWTGGTMTVVDTQSGGAEQGCTQTISSNTTGNGTTAPTFTMAGACATSFKPGDIVILSKSFSSTPESWLENSEGGFWSSVSGGGKLLPDTTDLCPTCGSQSLDMVATAAGSQAQAAQYFDSAPSMDAFVLLNGTYKISVWAKEANGTTPTMTITAARPSTGGFSCGPYHPALTSTWTQYTFTCTTSETAAATTPQIANLTVSVTGGEAYLDNVDFEQTNTDPTNTSVFRDPVINLLKQFYGSSSGGPAGLFRDWLNQNGTTLANWTQPDYAEAADGHGDGYYIGPNGTSVDLSLEDYLNVAKTIGAVPYLEVPVTFSTTDAANLIEFLNGPSTSAYGAKRAALGQTAPWTSVFPTIHLSFCNECWNTSSFSGQSLGWRSTAPTSQYYYDYSLRARDIFAAMRADTYYSSSAFDLVMNAQTATNWSMDTSIALAKPDSIEIEGYAYSTVNDQSSDASLWGSAMVEPYVQVTDPTDPKNFYQSVHDYQSQHTCGASGTAQCKVNVYEWGQGTWAGSIDQAHLNIINAGAGQGVIMPLQFLLNLQDDGIINQNFFSFTNNTNGGVNGETIKLWGNFVDAGGKTNNVRPEFLGVSLMNQSIIGPMYSCPIANNATYNFAGNANNGVAVPPGTPAMSNVPYLYSFCFENGSKRSLVLINTDLTNSYTIAFGGTNPPTGSVTERLYAPSSPDLMNEGPTPGSLIASAKVAIATSQLNSPTSLSLAPDSVVALDYSISTSTDTTPPTTSITSPVNGATVSSTITVAATASDNVGVTQVQLYADGAPVAMDTASPYTFSLNTVSLTNGSHTLQTKAYDAAGNVGSSAAVTITVNNTAGGDTTPPSQPTNLAVTSVTTSSVSLSWTASTDNVGVTGYNIYRSGTKVGTSNTTSFTNTGLTAETAYTYTVAAYDAAGNVSTQSGAVTGTTATGGSGGDTTPPTTPTNLAQTGATASTISLVWTASTDNVGVAGYQIFAANNQVGTSTGTGTSYTITGLQWPGTTYSIQIDAYDAAGNISGLSNFIIGTTASSTGGGDTTPPTTSITSPSNGATVSGTVSVAATASDNVGVSKVEFYIDGVLSGTDTASPYTFSFDSTALANGSHTLTTKAYDAAGNSAVSAGVTITVSNVALPPFQITSVTATPSSTSANLTITTNELASIRVQYGTSLSYGNTTPASPELTTIYENLTGLKANTTYNYRILSIPQGSTTTITSQNYTFKTAASTGGHGHSGK